MAQNVFDATLERNNRLDRNPFDWSHVWNGTTKHGTITPVFCELVPQKHSIRINPEFGLEMMPMVFPVQTRQFARINFFKVSLRSLWEDYMDYISNFREDLEEPYLLPDEQAFKKAFLTGTLGDYLNIPTRGVMTSEKISPVISGVPLLGTSCSTNKSMAVATNSDSVSLMNSAYLNKSFSELISSCFTSSTSDLAEYTPEYNSSSPVSVMYCCTFDNSKPFNTLDFYFSNSGILPTLVSSSAIIVKDSSTPNINLDSGFVCSKTSVRYTSDGSNQIALSISLTPEERAQLNNIFGSSYYLAVCFTFNTDNISSGSFKFSIPEFYLHLTSYAVSDKETSYASTPFATKAKPENLRLLAYKFRAYEAVYNAFYRDVRNDPFIVDGRPVYNKWLPTMKGGADSTPYELHQCNWERDIFTTCIPSPQQGRSPLAGLTVYDAVTANEDGSVTVKKAAALVTEDGAKYGINYKVSEDGEVLESVDYEPLSDKTEVTPIRSAIDLVNSGLSIETLRMTNAYQKYLELNMRKSFTYKAIMEGRYDVNLRFDELLMPEFIGGVSRELSMNVSEQSVDRQDTPDNGLYKDALGSKAGIAGVYGKANGNIECFCDEESIVIGLLTVTPVPIYTQMLPKDYTYRSILDHWAPEFSNIGYQPITYKEMCPLNVASNDDISTLEDTFGYQRPWYEHIAKYDTAHGLFRSNMNGFLMTRFFKGFPELGSAFLKVDPEVVNQVFSVTEFTDKIFGYVKFYCIVQSPIPRVAIPRID